MFSSLFESNFTELVDTMLSYKSKMLITDRIEKAAKEVNIETNQNCEYFIPIDIPVTKDHLEDIIILSDKYEISIGDLLKILINCDIISYTKIQS